MSSKLSYGSSDSDKSDSLICGFGPRRGHAGSISSGDNDELNENLICGFGRGGDGGSFASSGQSTGSGDILAAMKGGDIINGHTVANTATNQTKQQIGNGDQSQPLSRAAADTRGEVSPINNDMNEHEENYQKDIQIQHIPTKTDDGGDDSSPRRRRSIGSEGGLSMASEDAIVLMMNMLENSDEDGSNDGMSDEAGNEIIGRVYKKKPSEDFDSIPIELEINTSSMVSPPPIRHQDRRSVGDVGRTTSKIALDTNQRRKSDGVLAATGKKDEEIKQSPSPVVKSQPPNSALSAEQMMGIPLPKQPQNVEQAIPLPKKDNGGNNLSSQPITIQTNTEPKKSFTPAVPLSRRRSSGMDVCLDVIAEDESDESTAASHSVLKSSQSSKTSSKQTSQSGAAAFEDIIDESSFSMPNSEPLGEHAKSMAMQLGMVNKPKRSMRKCDLCVHSFLCILNS